MSNLAQLLGSVLSASRPSARLVGVVAAHGGDGFSFVQLPEGGIVRARGVSVAVGAHAFVLDGVVEGPAPDYEVDVEIEV
jgi:hypothetical protein